MLIDEIQKLFQSVIGIEMVNRQKTLDRLCALAKQLDTPDPLATYLNSDHYLIRLFAAEALGEINHDHSVEFLVKLLEKERYKEVQMSAVYSLTNINRFSALEALLNLTANPKSSKLVQSLAIQSVAMSTLKIVINPLFEILSKAETSEKFSVIENVFDAFEILEDDEQGILKRLNKLLRSENTSDTLLLYSIIYLGDRRYAEAGDAILTFLDSEDSDLRHASATALGNLGLLRFIPHLELKLDDKDATVRHAVEDALHQLKDSN